MNKNGKLRYFKVEDKINSLNKIRNSGYVRGVSSGFRCLDDYFTIKKGYPLYIAGQPFSGKTEFTLELLINLSVLYGWRHLVYSGESGSIEELIADLSYKLIGKPYIKHISSGVKIEYAMDEAEKIYAENFIANHFYFIDTEDELSAIDDFTIRQFYELAREIEVQEGITFDTTLIDPFNDVVDETMKYGGRQDFFLSDALKVSRRDAKRNNRLNIIITHIADIPPVMDKETKIRYTPVALPSEWAGGRTWHKRAFTMLLIYRPKEGVINEYGMPYKDNEVQIHIQKAKPKGIGKTGYATMQWDFKSNRYYWVDRSGRVCYAPRPNGIATERLSIINNNKLNDEEEELW